MFQNGVREHHLSNLQKLEVKGIFLQLIVPVIGRQFLQPQFWGVIPFEEIEIPHIMRRIPDDT